MKSLKVSLAVLLFVAAGAASAQGAHGATERARIEEAFRQRDYAAIEARLAELDRLQVQDAVGNTLSELSVHWERLLTCQPPAPTTPAPGQEPWTNAVCTKTYGEAFDAWQAAFPRSDLPAIGRAHLRAFEVSVIRPADPLWAIGHSAARNALDAVPSQDRSVRWYAAAFGLATLGGSPEAWMEKALAEAIRRYPGRSTLFRFAVGYHAPSNGGSYKQVDALARRLADANPGPTGDMMYAAVYDTFLGSSGSPPVFAYRQSSVDWSRMRAGLQARYKLHPHSWNALRTAQHACLAGDVTLLRQMLALGGSAPTDRTAWFAHEEDRCRKLGSPPPVGRGVAAVSRPDPNGSAT